MKQHDRKKTAEYCIAWQYIVSDGVSCISIILLFFSRKKSTVRLLVFTHKAREKEKSMIAELILTCI